MKSFEYILFDLDGTITDSAKGITDSVKYALEKMGEKIPPYKTLCRFKRSYLILINMMIIITMSGTIKLKQILYTMPLVQKVE